MVLLVESEPGKCPGQSARVADRRRRGEGNEGRDADSPTPVHALSAVVLGLGSERHGCFVCDALPRGAPADSRGIYGTTA